MHRDESREEQDTKGGVFEVAEDPLNQSRYQQLLSKRGKAQPVEVLWEAVIDPVAAQALLQAFKALMAEDFGVVHDTFDNQDTGVHK